jgi:transcriptional regulator with XRE-family HTH domain
MKRDRHSEFAEQRGRKALPTGNCLRARCSKLQMELAKKAGTTQSAIARLEDVEYAGHSLMMLERIAAACGVALKLRAEKRPDFDREVALV